MFHTRTRKIVLQQNLLPADTNFGPPIFTIGGARPKATGKNRALVTDACETSAVRALAIREKGG